jgi:chlorobactene glucosyltransferase
MHSSNLDVWTVIAWTVAGAWSAAMALFVRARRKWLVLRPLGERVDATCARSRKTHTSDVRCPTDNRGVTGNSPRLSVIVAARNEAACIETCLRSLLCQDYADFEVVAVNDRSSDGTAQILDRVAQEFIDRLRVVHVPALPAGWFGKPHALSLGLQSATGSLICFTDADCEFQSPAALRTTVAELFRRDLDFFSVTARYTMSSLRERVVVPCCSEALLTWLRPDRVDDPRTPDVFANGAFILVRRAPFDRIGGWEAVRTQISEDLQLARLAKQSGCRVGVSQNEGLYRTQSYVSLRDSWNGWSRIFNGTLNSTRLVVTLARMLAMFALPLGAVLWGVADGLRSGSFEWLTCGAGLGFAVAFGFRCVLDVAMFRLMGAPVTAALLAPLGRLFVMAITTRALL